MSTEECMEDTPITMESAMLRPSLMLTSMAATDTPMVASTAHMSTLASVMLRPSPTHGDMPSVAYTDIHMSTEVFMEDTLITMESAMLRPNRSSPNPMLTRMVDTWDEKELLSIGLNCNAFKQILLRKIIRLTY